MTYKVVAVHPDHIEVWDGETWIDPSHPGPKPHGQGAVTWRVAVGRPDRFQVNDVVELFAVLKERPEPTPILRAVDG